MSKVAENAVIAKLLATADVIALVGRRIYPRMAPQGKDGGQTPYIVVLRPEGQVNGQCSSGLYGVSHTPIFVACVGETYDESRSLSPVVVRALSPRGWTGSQVWGGVEVASCQLDDTFDRSSFPQLADEIGAPVEFVAFDLEHSTEDQA